MSGPLGGYDGVDLWTLRSWSTTTEHGRVVGSLHERLHHELQNTTLWGLLTRFCDDLRRSGVRSNTSRVLFWIGVLRAQEVHEVYATTLATGVDGPSVALLDDNPEYRAHHVRGLALLGATAESWEDDRYLIDSALRGCMMARGLGDLVGRFPALRISRFDDSQVRPDERLRALETLDLRPTRQFMSEGPPGDIPALRRLHDHMAAYLDQRGLPTLCTAEYEDAVHALIARVRETIPGIEIEIDDDREDAVADMLEESQRECIELHERPLPVELMPLSEAGARADQFVRDHEGLGVHLLAVWVRADLLARQFARPNGLENLDGHVLALQAADSADGAPVVRLAVADGLTDLAELAAGLTRIEVLFLTTQASILDAPEEVRFSGRRPIHVLVDQPVLEQLRHTFNQGAELRWARVDLGGDRALILFVFEIDALPHVRYLYLCSEVAADALTRWLRLRPAEQARADHGVWEKAAAEIEGVVQHVVAAWWRLDQIGARRG